MTERFRRHLFDKLGPRVLDVTEEQMAKHAATMYPTAIVGGMLIVQRALAEHTRAKFEIDLLAELCMREAGSLLEEEPPRPFSAYVGLEIAAAREPQLFGPSFRTYRDRLMRTVLGVARETGVMASVAETTVAGRWIGRNDTRVRAELVDDGSLRVVLANGMAIVLDPDRGMNEGCDA
ncbi:hypothetical protein ACNOYE_07950 [Nannocystaceae bacterium ST9]